MALQILVLTLTLALVSTDPTGPRDHGPALAESTMNLAFNLYQTMVKDPHLKSSNILFSPVVVASSLGVMSMGAKEETAAEVQALLNLPIPEDQMHPAFSELLKDIGDEVARNVTWKMSSRLYGPASANFRDDFLEKSRMHYHHDHSKINFRDRRGAIEAVNEWASQATGGRVSEVANDLSNADGAVLVNAMFFKPHWGEMFHSQMVDKRGFLVSGARTVSVPMMHRSGYYNYYEDEVNRLQVLEMPLAHGHSSMILLMPRYVEPLDRLENMLSKEQLASWLSKMQRKAVAISLPKVNLDTSHELQKHLQELGLSEAFDEERADFSGITGYKDLHLTNHLHAAAIEWDIEGKPYDHGTYNQEDLRSAKVFYADHPYIFLVRDNGTNAILLIGRLIKPEGEEDHDEL
ncbi:serpin H1-like [Ambystoma mexicanum]|uniref:serpin H1-like n=1 Tax=Ambystoma mexicanum TaxID=8296 RepID=UPI0037E90AE8